MDEIKIQASLGNSHLFEQWMRPKHLTTGDVHPGLGRVQNISRSQHQRGALTKGIFRLGLPNVGKDAYFQLGLSKRQGFPN